MNYETLLTPASWKIVNYRFANMLVDCGLPYKAELLNILLGCQAGQRLAAWEIGMCSNTGADGEVFVTVEPTIWYEQTMADEDGFHRLDVYADRSVCYEPPDEPHEIWLDMLDFLRERQDLFQGDSEERYPKFHNLIYYMLDIPDRFDPPVYLDAAQIRAAIMAEGIYRFQLFNNRLLTQKYGEDTYRDAGAVIDDIFVDENYYDICREHNAHEQQMESQTI